MSTHPPADFELSPSLMEGARTLELTAEQCDFEYWIKNVAQGTWGGLTHGHKPDTKIPKHMFEEGPLRTAMLKELAFRALSEEYGTRAITHIVRNAPTVQEMDFFVTQLADEARHGADFRQHMVDLGVPKESVYDTIQELAAQGRDTVLLPLQEFTLNTLGGRDDYIIGVVMLTIILEGVLAPASEMSLCKWGVLDPVAAEIARGANIDELRHLCVGASIVKQHLERHPEDKPRIMHAVGEGMKFWQKVPIAQVIYEREMLFQAGLEQWAPVVGDYEIVPGKRLVDTKIQDRMGIQLGWTHQLREGRLAYMKLLTA